MSSMRENETATETKTQYSDWPATDSFPSGDRFVLLAFDGLMGFAYNQEHRYCEVGVHCKAPHHEFSIEVYEFKVGSKKGKRVYRRKFGKAEYAPVDYIRIDIKEPKLLGVKFYMPKINEETGKVAADNNDFKLVPDLEGPQFYDRQLKKKPGSYKPKMHIKHGTFFTFLPTTEEFRRESPNDEERLGKIARIVGTSISLKPKGFVALRIGDEELRLSPEELSESPPQGKFYLVLFDNSCHQRECNYDAQSAKKEKRNDFYLYYETFEIPPDKEEYELRLGAMSEEAKEESEEREVASPPLADADVEPLASTFMAGIIDFLKALANDEAPCGGSGYGKSGGVGPGGS